ncbi:hypothetical protein HYDPIDRAFT_25885 [Hydnomerulius pinastri MD-312]|nr:hypothetical protein HYDPIDRAFT_25885 [Hydnomerulius pinastri MD-312]
MATSNLNVLVGPIEVGGFITCMFFGCAVVQAHVYYENHQEDHWAVKALVISGLILQLGQILSVCAAVYLMTVTDYGLAPTLVGVPHALDVSLIFSSLIGFGVQNFYNNPLYKFSHGIHVPIFCLCLSTTRAVLLIVLASNGISATNRSAYEERWGPSIASTVILSGICDLTIAAALSYSIKKQARGAIKKTTRVVNKIVMWSIETGLVTALTGVIEIALFLTMSDNYMWLGLLSFSSGLYVNSLLAALNRRAKLRQQLGEVHEFTSMGFVRRPEMVLNLPITADIACDTIPVIPVHKAHRPVDTTLGPMEFA